MTQTNEERNYIVYMHVNKFNNKVYIGITSKTPQQRWGLNGHNYKIGQTAFFGALKKYPDWENDWNHIILKENLTKDEACDAEIEFIATYKSNCCKYQNPTYGYNMTDGGEGRNGSSGMKGESNPNYGKTGRLNLRSKSVYCVEDEIYYESINIAAQAYNTCTSHISRCCKNPLRCTCNGKHFVYEEDVDAELISRCLLQKREHRVYCIETREWFDNAKDAAEFADVDVRNIRSSCHKFGQAGAGIDKETGNQLHWLYEADVNIENIDKALRYAISVSGHNGRIYKLNDIKEKIYERDTKEIA